MTISELWRHYDNMMEKAAHLEALLNEMESERQDLLAEAEVTLRTIDTIQGERDDVESGMDSRWTEIAAADLATAQSVSFG